jgi:multiple sugar transport system permease protein
VAPMLIYTTVLMIYPIVVNLRMSLYDVTIATFMRGDSPFAGFDNYAKLLHDPTFVKSVALSFIFTTVSISLQFIFGFALALFFNRPFPGNGFIRTMLLLAWLLPAVVVGNIFRWMLDGDYGPLNFVLTDLGLLHQKQYWLQEPATALAGVILANAWVGIPFNMMLLLAGLQTIPTYLYEAATIDGAGPWRRFRSITLPQMRPVALGVLLICFIYTFKVFDLIYIMTRGGPVDATQVLPIYAYKLTFDFFRFGDGAAASTILLLGLLILAFGYARLIRSEDAA